MTNRDRFDFKSFQKGDEVLVQTGYVTLSEWERDVFSELVKTGDLYICKCEKNALNVVNCVLYNDDTKHLEGVSEEAPSFYRYWEDDTCSWR